MKTKILEPTIDNINFCAKILKSGGLVAFPTETVYGLGGNALDKEAVARIYEAKGRPKDNPMIVHIASHVVLESLVKGINHDGKLLMDTFWPGPLTIIFRAKSTVPKRATGGLSTVAVRMPENEIALSLIERAGVPIAAPSANLSGRPSPTRVEHVVEDLDGRIDAILMGEECKIGVESTVIDMSGSVPTIFRPGKITAEEIEKVIGLEVYTDDTILQEAKPDLRPGSPGMKYRHYAPKAPMIILKGKRENIEKEIEYRKATFDGKLGIILFDWDKPEEAAHDFYRALRKMDEERVDLILAGAVSTEGLGLAVMNRMLKSAAHQVLEV